jgi:hypothetical protein
MFFDAKRNRAVVIGRDAIVPLKGGIAIYDFSKNPLAVSRQVITALSGNTAFSTIGGPGGRYDPVADLYLVWNGGKNLWSISPNTLACTLVTPDGDVTPSIPVLGENPGGGTWDRFSIRPRTTCSESSVTPTSRCTSSLRQERRRARQ